VRQVLYENIKHSGNIPLSNACSTLSVSRHAYENWLNKPVAKNNNILLNQIKKIGLMFPRYGYRRITAQLKRNGLITNHKKVLKVMRNHCLLAKNKKKFKPQTTNSNHDYEKYSNLVKDLEVTRLNQVWVSDITYIGLQHEFVYLAVLMDMYSRKCLGWDLSRNINTQLTLTALKKALKHRKQKLNDLIHHSDQGVQYACREYTNLLKQHGIQISMSRKANPYDNAYAESFIKTLKYEEILINEYTNFQDAYKNIENFIETVYNKKRLHSSLGYLPPTEYEKTIKIKGGIDLT
jgi:putative transposase